MPISIHRPPGVPPSHLRVWLWAGIRRLGLALVLVASPGCSLLVRDAPVPLPLLVRPWAAAGRTSTLVVWLPGRGDVMTDFDQEGIRAIMREAGVQADAVVVDAHLGYYYKRTIIDRLRADVLEPARRQGYRRIVLVGVSLGGLGSLLNERDNPGAVDALVLLSPNLGDEDKLFDRIAAAGGPAAWAAGRDAKSGSVYEELWTFLGTKTPTLPATWLFYGRGDSYGRGHRLLAGLLPAERVTTIEGAHDWPTWRALWRDVCFRSEVFAAERTAGTAAATAP